MGNRNIRKVGSVIALRTPQLSGAFSEEDGYHVLKTQLIYEEPYENPDAYAMRMPNRHSRELGFAIPLMAPKLSDVFAKEDFYPIWKHS